jgi:preprotein translocase subunit SecF
MRAWKIDFYGHRKIYYTISTVIIAIMIICALIFGVKMDIQFKGGALLTYSYTGELDPGAVEQLVQQELGTQVSVQESTDIVTGSSNVIVSIAAVKGFDVNRQNALDAKLAEAFPENSIKAVSVNVVDPIIGNEFLLKSLIAISLASLLMVLFVAWRFARLADGPGCYGGHCACTRRIDVFSVFIIFRFRSTQFYCGLPDHSGLFAQ